MSEESDAFVVSETYDRIQILGFICVLLIVVIREYPKVCVNLQTDVR